MKRLIVDGGHTYGPGTADETSLGGGQQHRRRHRVDDVVVVVMSMVSVITVILTVSAEHYHHHHSSLIFAQLRLPPLSSPLTFAVPLVLVCRLFDVSPHFGYICGQHLQE